MTLEQQLARMQKDREMDLSTARSNLGRAIRKRDQAEQDSKVYSETITVSEQEIAKFEVLRAVAKSLDETSPQLIGNPVLVWVDLTATAIHGPAITVYPLEDPHAHDYDFDEEEDD